MSARQPLAAPSRRGLFATAGGALVAGATLATASRGAVAADNDAELIRICHQFAENELEHWYLYVVTPEPECDDLDDAPDWSAYHRIVATAATTPAGWHAKALAYTAWDRDAYDDHKDNRDPATTFLAALLRDIVAPARRAIVARLAAQYGPLPSSYTSEGIWIGYTQEERALIDEKLAGIKSAREAEAEAEMAEIYRRANVETMTRAELEESIPGMLEVRDKADRLYRRIIERLEGDVT